MSEYLPVRHKPRRTFPCPFPLFRAPVCQPRFPPARSIHHERLILGISHASLYRLIGAGRLDARKLGGKTLITAESIERLVAELPKAGGGR
jgi:hypothetical protein